MSFKSIHTEFTPEDIQTLDVELKVGILGTVNDDGLPHLTMISSLRPYAVDGLVWGQFTEGLSKQIIRKNPRTGFLIMSLDKNMWRGKADFTHTANSGPEYENFNNLPMFRYNAYFGIHTVYYMDLVEQHGVEPLPMGQVVVAAVQTILARILGKSQQGPQVLNPWVRGLFNKLDNLKFLGYVGEDGYPVILPVIQSQALDGKRVIFSRGAYRNELEAIPPGVPMAVFGMSFSMEDVLLRGTYEGIRRIGGVKCGVVDINWVYNSMPPVPKQIYPPLKIEAVTEF
ncbi:MAG: hypothetical protein GWN30_06340 [Gammaproteobacteria bacterium]|nr:hypothetical protein [Gammaproteobacteria bacterium]